MKYRIKKIKMISQGFENPKIELSFEKLDIQGFNKISDMTIKTSYFDSKKLRETFYDLRDEFFEIAEIQLLDSDTQLCGIKELRFKHDDDKGLGIEMIAEITLKGSHDNLILQTPLKWETVKNQKERMRTNLRLLLDEVISEAEVFIDMNERQYELKFGEQNVSRSE
jgi:hypothetical protein